MAISPSSPPPPRPRRAGSPSTSRAAIRTPAPPLPWPMPRAPHESPKARPRSSAVAEHGLTAAQRRMALRPRHAEAEHGLSLTPNISSGASALMLVDQCGRAMPKGDPPGPPAADRSVAGSTLRGSGAQPGTGRSMTRRNIDQDPSPVPNPNLAGAPYTRVACPLARGLPGSPSGRPENAAPASPMRREAPARPSNGLPIAAKPS